MTIASALNLEISSTDQPRPVALSVFVLTKNESSNLRQCLESLRGCCDDIHVVDSFSTDDTVEIAQEYGAIVVQHAFEGHTRQRTWALQHLAFRHEWVIALDADHRVTPELNDELKQIFMKPPEGVAGLFVKRRQIFRGRWMRHGGYYPKYMLKIFRHSAAYLDNNEFDYRFYVNGRTETLKHDILEANQNEWRISFFIEKHNKFASELAAEEVKREGGGLPYLVKPSFFGNPDQRTLWLKLVWRHFPLYVRPFLMFVYRYLIRLGFLDGKEGFIFYFLQTFWFRLLVDIRLEEMRAEQRIVIPSTISRTSKGSTPEPNHPQ
ncbi:MAG: glycosyltransferase family 2 protein [Acidobacteriota bacterium]